MDADTEIWKPVKGFTNYLISNIGRVKSLPRVTVNPKTGKSMTVHGRMLKQFINYRGYADVHLYNNGVKRKFKAHRLVADAFCTGNIEGMTVDHLNEIKTDNRPENLEIVTNLENMRRAQKTRKANNIQKRGCDLKSAKLNKEQVKMIRECYSYNPRNHKRRRPFSLLWLGNAFGVSLATIHGVVTGKTYANVK